MVHLYKIAINFKMFLNNYCCILWNYNQHYNIHIFSLIYSGIIYFAYAIGKWCTILKYYFFISFFCLSCYLICSSSANCYSSFVILLAILLPLKLTFVSAVLEFFSKFLDCFLKHSTSLYLLQIFSMIKKFWAFFFT